MRQEVLDAALRALLFAQAWVDGWRPGRRAELRGVALLAVKCAVDPTFDEGLEPLESSFVPGLYLAPTWLADGQRPSPTGISEEPTATFLHLLGLVARYRQPGRLGLGRFLRQQLKRSTDEVLIAHAAMLHAVEPLAVDQAARRLAKGDLRGRFAWLSRYNISLCRRELVLALHAAQAGGFLLPAVLPLLGELGEPWPAVCLLLAALFCAAQSPTSATPATWNDFLTGEAAGILDAAVAGRGAGARP